MSAIVIGRERTALLFLAPAALVLAVVYLGPMLLALKASFTAWVLPDKPCTAGAPTRPPSTTPPARTLPDSPRQTRSSPPAPRAQRGKLLGQAACA